MKIEKFFSFVSGNTVRAACESISLVLRCVLRSNSIFTDPKADFFIAKVNEICLIVYITEKEFAAYFFTID